MEQVFSGQVLVETSARYEALTIEDGAVLTAPAGKFVCMTVNGVGCDPKPGRYVGDIALTLADSYPMAPHGLMRINGRGRDFQEALVVDTTAGQVVEAQCVPELVQGGTVTGEHGVGISKALNFQQERKTEIECINDIKRAFDPKNILNPGKASQWRGSPLQHLRYPCKEYM